MRIALSRKFIGLFSLLGMLLLAGCGNTIPPEPTVIVRPTQTDTPTSLPPSPTALPAGPTATFLPTSTPLPTEAVLSSPVPLITSLPTFTPPPATATAAGISMLPTVVPDERGGQRYIFTEAQINAALAQAFDAAPLLDYASAPRVILNDDQLLLSLRIRPHTTQGQADQSAQALALSLELRIVNGALETYATHLVPINAGVTTQQVKLADVLLGTTLRRMVLDATGVAGGIVYLYADMSPQEVAFTVLIPR